MYHTDNVFDIYGVCGSKNKRPKFGLRFLIMRGSFFSPLFLACCSMSPFRSVENQVVLNGRFVVAVCVDTKWLGHWALFTQDRRLYLKKRSAAIVIACYVRGWKVGFISVMEVTGKETELSFFFILSVPEGK